MLKLILSMLIFGTIGILRRNLELGSGLIACARGLLGAVFLFILIHVRGNNIDREIFYKNGKFLILSGIFMGFNWVFLFEAYNYTSVAVATLCYYMAPIIVIAMSPIVLKEQLNLRKIICVAIAMLGMVFVSGIVETGIPKINEAKGILYGLGAAVLYACVIIINKKISGINIYDKTMIQLLFAGLVLIPYTLFTEDIKSADFTIEAIVLLLVLGFIYTGFTYSMYFGSLDKLSAQTVALLSYIDPITSIILSALILNEKMSIYGIIGTMMVLGATIWYSLGTGKKSKNE